METVSLPRLHLLVTEFLSTGRIITPEEVGSREPVIFGKLSILLLTRHSFCHLNFQTVWSREQRKSVLAFTSPNVISPSPKKHCCEQYWVQFFWIPPKNFIWMLSKWKTEFTSPIAKPTCCGLLHTHYFLWTLIWSDLLKSLSMQPATVWKWD